MVLVLALCVLVCAASLPYLAATVAMNGYVRIAPVLVRDEHKHPPGPRCTSTADDGSSPKTILRETTVAKIGRMTMPVIANL